MAGKIDKFAEEKNKNGWEPWPWNQVQDNVQIYKVKKTKDGMDVGSISAGGWCEGTIQPKYKQAMVNASKRSFQLMNIEKVLLPMAKQDKDVVEVAKYNPHAAIWYDDYSLELVYK